MLITAKSDYALRAVCLLAREQGRRVKAEELARDARIPRQYLENIMAALRDRGIVRARRGSDGGYELVDDPQLLDVGSVLTAVGSAATAERFDDDDDSFPEVAEFWNALIGTVRDVVERVTVADLVAGTLAEDLRHVGAVERRRSR